MNTNRNKKPVKKEKKKEDEKVNTFVDKLMGYLEQSQDSEKRVDMLLNTVSYMLEQAGGTMVVDIKRGHEIRHEYTLETTKSSAEPYKVKLSLKVREKVE